MKIIFPLPEKISTNKIYAGVHWSVRQRHAEMFKMTLFPFRRSKVKKYPIKVSYEFSFKSRPLDVSNCFYMVKMIEDGMKVNGIIQDDCPEYVSEIKVVSVKGIKDEVCIVFSH